MYKCMNTHDNVVFPSAKIFPLTVNIQNKKQHDVFVKQYVAHVIDI